MLASTQIELRVLETVPVASVLTVVTTAVYWVGRIVGGPETANAMAAARMVENITR